MLVVVIPVVVALGVVVVVTAAGGGGWWFWSSLRKKLKRRSELVTDVSNLRAGDRISLSWRPNVPFRHAIVVKADGSDVVGVVFFRSGSGNVTAAEISLLEDVRRNRLYKISYDEPLISFSANTVVDRAMSVCLRYHSSDRHGQIRSFWPFFTSGIHFANWCQIGFKLKTVARATTVSSCYVRTHTDLRGLKAGDHVVTECGESGIVLAVDRDNSTLEMATFSDGQCHRRTVDVHAKVFRCDYDVAVGGNDRAAKEAALTAVAQPPHQPPYSSGEEFAVWCRTRTVVDAKLASALAAARMLGRVWVWVRDAAEIRPGDHVAFNSGTVYYYQHAIVSDVNQGQATLVYLVGNTRDPSQQVVREDQTIDLQHYANKEHLCKYFYGNRHWDDPNGVIGRATIENLDRSADELPFKDPEHFAIYCKTGGYQLQF